MEESENELPKRKAEAGLAGMVPSKAQELCLKEIISSWAVAYHRALVIGLSGQMSGVTENKFIFPQWKKGKKDQLCPYETNTCTFRSLAGAGLKVYHEPCDF